MAFVSRSLIKPPCLLRPCRSILPSKPRGHGDGRFSGCNFVRALPRNKVLGERLLSTTRHFSRKHIATAQNDHYSVSYEDDLPPESFWAFLIRDAARGLNALFSFFAEQPSQLKYIEWPSFQSTLKTAFLTLIIVALFIVALALVDNVLCHLLTLALKR